MTRLRGWATSSNPMFAKALAPALAQAIKNYDTKFFPGGQPAATWPDGGSTNWEQYYTEAYAEFFAFMAQVDPNPAARDQHAQRARNLLMHVMNEAAKGPASAPFRSPTFSTSTRAQQYGEAFGLTVDWIYPYLSDADKATIRAVFLRWSKELVNASAGANEHPMPVGLTNDPALLQDRKQLRTATGRHFNTFMRQLALLSLSLDDADDPPIDGSKPAAQLGNTLRSYVGNVTGAWLYAAYAELEDPAVVAATLGVNGTGLGLASGGLPSEGFEAGKRIGALAQTLLALRTAGLADPAISGPQINLVTSGYWDRLMAGFLASIAPQSGIIHSWIGPVFGLANYGSNGNTWVQPEYVGLFGALAQLDYLSGNTQRLAHGRWIARNVLPGGAAGLYQRAGSGIWSNNVATHGILYFMTFDPAAPIPADPRPSLPTSFLDRALGRLLARTDWTANQTWFNVKCGWNSLSSQNGDCGQFELYRKGEWLTRGLVGNPNDGILLTSDYHNTLAIQNDKPANLQWFEAATAARGGQWTLGSAVGDPTMQLSTGPGYAYAQADATNLYNRRNNTASDVLHASRSIVWLQPDLVVVYDRAQTKTAGRFKRFNLSFVGDPFVTGHTTTVTNPSGQKLFVQTLLPAVASITAGPKETISGLADGEPAKSRLVVTDPGNPTNASFLHVLQGADANASQVPSRVVQSGAGTPFTGAIVGPVAILFAQDIAAPFSSLTVILPSTVTARVITGLVPNGQYDVTITSVPDGHQVTVSPGTTYSADSAGLLVVGTLP